MKIKTLGKFIYRFKWSDDGKLWSINNPKDSTIHWVLLHLHIVERDNYKALNLIVGKASLIIGWL
jgi:hypothetical protein